MIPAAFDYDVAESVEHALELLADGWSDAKLLAGGHSLIPALKLRIARPSKLVDIGRLADLAYVRDGGTHVAIGALTRHAAVAADPLLAEHCPIVSHTAGQIGDPQVRSSRHDRRHARPRRPGLRPARGDARARRRVVVARDGRRAGDPGDGVLHRRLRDGVGAGRGPRRGAGAEARRARRAGATSRRTAARRTGRPSASRRSSTATTARSRARRSASSTWARTPLRAKAAEDALAGGASVADAAALVTDGAEPPSDLAGLVGVPRAPRAGRSRGVRSRRRSRAEDLASVLERAGRPAVRPLP